MSQNIASLVMPPGVWDPGQSRVETKEFPDPGRLFLVEKSRKFKKFVWRSFSVYCVFYRTPGKDTDVDYVMGDLPDVEEDEEDDDCDFRDRLYKMPDGQRAIRQDFGVYIAIVRELGVFFRSDVVSIKHFKPK